MNIDLSNQRGCQYEYRLTAAARAELQPKEAAA
jgi:hypothetical protein